MPDKALGKLDGSLCEKACLRKNDPSDCAASRIGDNPVADQPLADLSLCCMAINLIMHQ